MRDLHHGLRRLIHDWRFTIAAVLILSLGIGANTAMFSLINAALFRPSIVDAERLVDIYQNASNPEGLDGNSYPVYLDVAAYTDVFAQTTAASIPRPLNYQDGNTLRTATAEHTTATYLDVLGLRPALGRWFTAAEDAPGAAVVAVLGHQAWTKKFGADPSIVGRTITMEGVPVTIVGVGPAGHNATLNIGIVTDFWLPIGSLPILGAPPRVLNRRPDESIFFIKARLRDGVTTAQARAAMQILGTRLASEYPNEDPGKGISVFAARDVRVHPQMDGTLRGIAFVLLAIVALVLAIACGNLATLLVVRGAARAKEISVRLALGATRGQLVRHLVTESLLLSAGGGIAGCILAWWAIRLLGAIDLPLIVDLTLDYRVLMFAVGLSLVTGVAFGLAPALKTTGIDVMPALRDGRETRSADRRRLTIKNAAVALQVAGSVVLLGSTSIFLQMLDAAGSASPGFAIDGIAMLQTDPRYAGYSPATARNILEDIRRRVSEIPGVQSAVLARGLPMQVNGMRVIVDGQPAQNTAVFAGQIWAGPGYFDILRIPILYGRAIDERDRRDTPLAAVVSEAMARQYFGASNAVGRRFRFEQETNRWYEVVGVAANTGTAGRTGDLVDPTPQLFYRSFAQSDVAPDTVLARTALNPSALVGDMQREMRTVNAALPAIAATTMTQYLDDGLLFPKAAATLFGGLGALALALAAIGLYAVIVFAVSRRSREIGIRMALGARSPQVVFTIVREAAALVAVGTAIGLFVSLLVTLALRSVSPSAPGLSVYRPAVDPLAMIAIAAFMIVVAAAAASMPAWRAVRMNPLTALRHM